MKKVRKSSLPKETPQDIETVDMLSIIAGDTKNVKTIHNTLRRARCVETIFSSFNRATTIGGAPVACTYLIHGPPSDGKTTFAIGLANSFVKFGHGAAYIDSEHALDKDWLSHLKTNSRGILFEQPDNLESAIDTVDEWILNFKKGKIDKKIPDDRAFIIIVDTIHKIPPKRELDSLRSDKAKGGGDNIDKAWGRYRAAMIAAWLDRLTPIVGKNDVAFVCIAHESEESSQSKNFFKKDEYRVKGGKGLIYEASMRIRITKGSKIYNEDKSKLIGETHRFKIEKNKVGHPYETGKFFIGNGTGDMPIGFDLERELLEEMFYRGILQQSGNWYTLPNGDRMQGKENLLRYLRENENVYNSLFTLLNNEIHTKG